MMKSFIYFSPLRSLWHIQQSVSNNFCQLHGLKERERKMSIYPLQVYRGYLINPKKKKMKEKKPAFLICSYVKILIKMCLKFSSLQSRGEYKLQRVDFKNIHLGHFFHPEEIHHAFPHHLMLQHCTKNKNIRETMFVAYCFRAILEQCKQKLYYL